jgi:hypothetical protein
VASAFDIYAFGPGAASMTALLTAPNVEHVEVGTQFTIDPVDGALDVRSGSVAPAADAQLYLHAAAPSSFTLDVTLDLAALPANFSSVPQEHVYLGVFDPAGPVCALLVSKIGLAYAGSAHVTSNGDFVLDGPLQPLPNSQVLVQEGDVVTFRLAADSMTDVVYIYVTRASDVATLGHQLRYMMPVLPASTMAVVPPNETLLSVQGSSARPSFVRVLSLALGTGILIPNLPPHADGGNDQAVRTCSVVELDGTRSFDPEGAPLLYQWRLIDAPPGSQYLFEGLDGHTQPLAAPTGETDTLYSASLGAAHARDPMRPGDVLVVRGKPTTLAGVGTDATGFFAKVEGFVLPDNLTGAAFLLLRQRGLSRPTDGKPTFFPDVPGLFRFDLTVFDGSLYSPPAITVVNVTESPIPRGLIPDVRFLWNTLSDFWRLVEDTERIETFWSGLAQVAAAELLALWQIDYSKSLRDVPRTFQRRWLHYDLAMQESLPELTTLRATWSGLESLDFPTGGLGGTTGLHVDLLLGEATSPLRVPIGITGALTAGDVATSLRGALALQDARITVRVLTTRAGTLQRVRVDAPYPIAVAPSSYAPFFAPDAGNAMPTGSGAAVSARTYRVDRSLQGLDVREGDLLLLGDAAYRIARVVDDPRDPWPMQRITLLDAIPIPAIGTWRLPGMVVSPSLDFHQALITTGDHAYVEVLAPDDTAALIEVDALGACAAAPHSLAADLTRLGIYLAEAPAFRAFLARLLRRTYVPIDPLVVDVPFLQEKIRAADDSEVLRRNVDFFVTTYRGTPCLRFVTGDSPAPDVWEHSAPPARLWAEVTYLDNRPTVEANFGIPVGFTLDDLSALPSNVDYLSSVRGLWYAYFNGPTLYNLRVGVQILLGLPFAEEAGTIEEIRNDFSMTQGRILVRDVAANGIVRSYSYPHALDLETNPATGRPYKAGDAVAQFAPLTSGVEIVDYVKDPEWFRGYAQQGAFFEVEKFFTFLVRVDATAFNLAALLFVQTFILRVKPTYTFPLFVVRAAVNDTEVEVEDELALKAQLILDAGVCQDTAWGDTMFDQARPAGGGWKSQFDERPLALGPPSAFPTPSYPIAWGFDRAGTLCPDYDVVGKLSTTFAAASVPTFDSVFGFDRPVFTSAALFEIGQIVAIDAGPVGTVLFNAFTATTAGTFTELEMNVEPVPNARPNKLELIVEKNGSDVLTLPLPPNAHGFHRDVPVSLPYQAGDVFRIRIRPADPNAVSASWRMITVVLGHAVSWAFGTAVPAGSYYVYKDM